MTAPSLEPINSLPPSVQLPVGEFTRKLLGLLNDNVRSVIVYGSAAGLSASQAEGNYNPGVSNINIAVVVKELDLRVLGQVQPLVTWGRKHRISVPLILTREYILNSLDVFPIEFSEIKDRHKLIFGEDVFKDLDIPRKDVSLLCEQQIKGKLLHLRQAYLETGPNPKVLKRLLLSVFTDLIAVFRQLILLKGQQPAQQKEEMLQQLASVFSLDLEPFLAVYHDKNTKAPILPHQVQAHLQNFLNQLEKLSRHLDSL